MGEEAARGRPARATIATGQGPERGPGEGLRTHVANREQNRRRAMHTPVHDVSTGSVDNARALDWRAGHSTLPLAMKRTYQPKKRKRARTHGFRARMQHARRPPDAQAPPRQGPQAADRLTAVDRLPRAVRPAPEARAPLAQRGVRARLPPGPVGRQPLPRPLQLPALVRGRAGRRHPPGRVGRRARSAAPSIATRSSACSRGFRDAGRASCRPTRTSSWSRAPRCASWPSATGWTGVRARAGRARRRSRLAGAEGDGRDAPAGRSRRSSPTSA